MQRGYQETVCDGLRHNVNDPYPEHMWASGGQLVDRLFQLATEREDLIGITKYQPTDICEFQVAPNPREQVRT